MSRLNKLIFFLICAVVVFSTLAYGTVHQPTIALFYLLTTIMVLLWAADCLLSGVIRFSNSLLQMPLILLGLYALIQVIPFGTYSEADGLSGLPRTISYDPFSTQLTALHIFALGAFFFLALVSLESTARLRRICSVITIFGFVYAFYAILQSVLSPEAIYGIYRPRSAVPFGSFVNRHDFAAIIEMAVSLPLGLIFMGAVRGDKRLLYLVAIVLMGISLLLSGSRGGLVAFFAEVVILVILSSRAKGRKNLILKVAMSSLLVISAVGGAIFVGGDTSLTRFTDSASSGDISSSRFQIWSVTTKMIAENLPFGAGIGAYASVYTGADPSGGYQRIEQAHNDYLQIVADAGIVGLLIGAFFLFLLFREGFSNIRTKNQFKRAIAVGSFAGCCSILIHSIFDFVLHITAVSVMFLTLMAILVASGRKFSDESESEEDNWPEIKKPAEVMSISDRKAI